MSAMSLAIILGVSTLSTAPDAMALRGMPSVLSVARILSKCGAPCGLDRLQAIGAVRGDSRQNDPNRQAFARRGNRLEEQIDRQVLPTFNARRELQESVIQAKTAIGRDHVNVAGLDRHPICHL